MGNMQKSTALFLVRLTLGLGGIFFQHRRITMVPDAQFVQSVEVGLDTSPKRICIPQFFRRPGHLGGRQQSRKQLPVNPRFRPDLVRPETGLGSQNVFGLFGA